MSCSDSLYHCITYIEAVEPALIAWVGPWHQCFVSGTSTFIHAPFINLQLHCYCTVLGLYLSKNDVSCRVLIACTIILAT